jgi:hypothetical protein
MQASISSGCRNDIALHGGWDAHSSALGLQTQQSDRKENGLEERLIQNEHKDAMLSSCF